MVVSLIAPIFELLVQSKYVLYIRQQGQTGCYYPSLKRTALLTYRVAPLLPRLENRKMDFNIAKKPDENDRVHFGWKITVIRKSFASLKKWLGHNYIGVELIGRLKRSLT